MRSSRQRSRKIVSSLGGSRIGGNKWKLQASIGLVVVVILFVAYMGVYLFAFHSVIETHETTQRSPQPPTVRRKATEDQSHVVVPQPKATTTILVMNTAHGAIRVEMRPDLSPESVAYIESVVTTQSCQRCSLYRAEKPGILQGIIKSNSVALPNKKGDCPPGSEDVPNNCPSWDSSCGCHGPVNTHGMVGWAAGKTGPDFFFNTYKRKAQWWGTQHTLFGQVKDEASFQVIDTIYDLPANKNGGLTYLKEPVRFTMRLVTAS